MIVIENVLSNLVSQFPSVELPNGVILNSYFGSGNKDELNRFLAEYKSSTYPLVWLLPSSETHNNRSNTVNSELNIIIANLEKEASLLNHDRFRYNFDLVLNPVFDYLFYALDNSSKTRITNYDISVFKHPNYTDNTKESKGLIDLWDALKININVEFNNNCLKDILWQGKKL